MLYVESIMTMYGNGGGIWAEDATIIADNVSSSAGGGICLNLEIIEM